MRVRARWLGWIPAFAGMTLTAAGMTVPSLAWADAPSDYRGQALITTQSKDALHRVALPYEAYRDARPDFSDLRIFNAAGEALPFAFAGEPESVKTEAPSVMLPVFPVSAPPATRGKSGDALAVVVKSGANGTIVSVQGNQPGKYTSKPAAWLLDASQLKEPMRALDIDWDVGPGTEIVKVNVEASDDLKWWGLVAAQAQLVHLEQGPLKMVQRRIELHNIKAKYLRVTSDTAGFVLKSVEAISVASVAPAPRSMRAFRASDGTKPGVYEYDLGARLPVEAMHLVIPPNTVAPFTISTRETAAGKWSMLTSATFYRLERGGTLVESPAIEVGRRPAREVQLQLDPHSPSLGGDSPALEVQWRPAQLVFVARGDGPYEIAFGNAGAERSILALTQVMPGYKAGDEMKIPEDAVASVTVTARTEGPMRSMLGEVNGRKLVLWAVLLVAVALLAWMAWRLSRQMKGGS